jgi:alcohol oxidase
MFESSRYVVPSHIAWLNHMRFADCSIAPGNVGENTYNTVIAIGEKVAVLIAKELGI